LKQEIEKRDRQDASRVNSPLRKAEDAIELDTTKLSVDDQVQEILNRAEQVIQTQS
jgi:cytidylate kinase